MKRQVIAIDGGATKTIARLLTMTRDGYELQHEYKTGASSLTQDYVQAASHVCELLTRCLQHVDEPLDVSVVMGLAGAGHTSLKENLINYLCKNFALHRERLFVTSDAVTALYGANKGAPVACLALGTGSVGMRLDHDGNVQQVGGWGATLADEGGAVYLGRLAVRQALWELDCVNKAPSKLGTAILNQIGRQKVEILNWISLAKSTEFGALAPSVTALIAECEVAKTLFSAHIQEVEKLADAVMEDLPLPLVLVGGLAAITEAHLPARLRSSLVNAKGQPIDGACELARKMYIKEQEQALC
jgi:glucosamine kinase